MFQVSKGTGISLRAFIAWEIFSNDFAPNWLHLWNQKLYTCTLQAVYKFIFYVHQLYSLCREIVVKDCVRLRLYIRPISLRNKNPSKESGGFRLFARYGTFSWITEKYDVTPLSTQLPAHSSPSFTELPRAVLQAAFVQSRIAVGTHALGCALLFSTQNWVPPW